MKSSWFPFAAALAATLSSGLAVGATPSPGNADTGGGARPVLLATPSSLERSRYTVVLADAPLASYDGTLDGHAALPRVASGKHAGRVDVNAPAARAYLDRLAQKQAAFLAAASTQVGRTLVADVALRHALNAVILDLSDAEADTLRRRVDVRLVDRERQLDLVTDRGPAFIGAPSIWDGSATGGAATRGEGIVAGVLDSGINWQSPAFAATGPVDGYAHVNPLGAGNYLGLCGAAAPNADLGRCNDKLIGMYNFTSTSPARSAADDNGHGSHTASTVAGNAWDAPFGGGTFRISGVAPHANVIAYKVCVGGCPSTAITQAADQAVADGIVDVINVSITGGAAPWTETNSLAFLGAHDAGIFIAAAAGNSGPAAGTSEHQEPWVQTVAAATHDRVLGFNLDATAPGNPPANTRNIPLRPGAQPVQSVDFYNIPIVQSPGFGDGRTDGCDAFPAGTFTRPWAPPADRVFADGFDPPLPPPPVGAIAVLNLDQNDSGCGSGTRQANAVAAGAVGVIFVDPFYINLGASGNAWSMLRANWDRLAQLDPAAATVSITRPARAYPGAGDVVADFSARGPRALADDQWLVKPDIAAPGVDVLAAYQANVGATPNPSQAALQNGTSMASPHVAGAAALLRALHPTWTPMQIKSALMLTAKTSGLVRQSGQPADAWDRGAGRVDLAAAAKAGLVLDETGAKFLAANPAGGGDVSGLNLPSLASARCIGTCTWTRTVRRALAGAQTYTVTTAGFPSTAVTVTPASFTIGSSATRTLTITVQSQLLPAATWSLGEVVLTPTSPSEPPMHLPVAIRPVGPIIDVAPGALVATSSGGTDVKTLTIRNLGNPTLDWSIATGAAAPVTALDTIATSSGRQAGYYDGSARGYYWMQHFDVAAQTHVTLLRANGLTVPSTPLDPGNTPSVTFGIYADAAGVPAGAPEGFGAPMLWRYTNTIGAAGGITATDDNLEANLAAPGASATPLDLPPGRYWLLVSPNLEGQGTGTVGNPAWGWRVSSTPATGPAPQLYAPWDDPSNWQSVAGVAALSARVQGTVDCTQPAWIRYGSSGGALGYAGQAAVEATFDAGDLAAGTYRATLCLASNATNTAMVTVPLEFSVIRQPPTVSNAFAPTSITTATASTLTLTLANPNPAAATLTHDFVGRLPPGVFVAPVANAATTCIDGSVTASGDGTAATLARGARIPANGSCTVAVDVRSRYPQTYTQTIAPGTLRTAFGDNAASASTALAVVSTGMGGFPPAENFDGVVPPALPAGWTTWATGSGVPFVTQASLSHTAPNALFVPEQETMGESFLVSPTVSVAAGARLTFRHRVRTEENLDGGTLEISTDGGPFVNAQDAGALFVSGAFTGSIARVTNCDADPLAPYGWVLNTGSGASGTSAVNIVLPNAMAGHDVAFRWRHGSDCSLREEGGGWWIDSINLDTGNGITLDTAFVPTNTLTGTAASEVLTLGSTRADPVTLTAALATNLPNGLVFADPPNAGTTCSNTAVTAVAGTRALTVAAGAVIPAFGTCTVRYDVVAANMGMYKHTIAASALKTSGGNNLMATSAIYQAVTPGVPTMTTGFEPPQFAPGGFPQLAWLGGSSSIAAVHPASGVQHVRIVSNGGNYTQIDNATAVISPTNPQGATQYSIATAKLAVGNTGTGSTWFLKPTQDVFDPNTYVRFDVATHAISAWNAATRSFVDTGATWPDASYFEIKVVIERATKALRVCLDGATIYTGVAVNPHMRTLEFGGVMEGGSNGSTLDIDDVTLDNVNDDGGCTP